MWHLLRYRLKVALPPFCKNLHEISGRRITEKENSRASKVSNATANFGAHSSPYID